MLMKNTQYRPLYKNLNCFWLWFALAQLSFLTTLWLPYQGEEGVYTITSMEMAARHEWIAPTLYGENYARPPLLNWLMIPLAHCFGWQNVLVVSRSITIVATLLTSLLLIWFVHRIFRDRLLAIFSGLIFVSGDMLFRRGWLAYADPLFSLWVFAAIAFLWIAVEEEKPWFLLLAAVGLMASFLTKAMTGYLFYGVALCVLGWRKGNWQFFLKKEAVVLHGLAVVFPLVWSQWISQGAHGFGMIYDIISKLNFDQFNGYFVKLACFPFDTLLRWLPLSALLIYFGVTSDNKKGYFIPLKEAKIQILLWMVGLNYLPYWLAPETHARYLMPLYPLFSIVLAYWIVVLGEKKLKCTLTVLCVCIVLRYVAGIFIFPYYEQRYRGDYQAVAADILTIAGEEPLYSVDYSAVGLSVSAAIDAAWMPRAVLVRPPLSWESGFVISRSNDILDTTIKKVYRLGTQRLYLLCRGEDCYGAS